MLYTQFQASKPSGSEEEDILYFSMYFNGSHLRPSGKGHLGPRDLHLNKLGKGPLGNAIYTKFQASEPSGS